MKSALILLFSLLPLSCNTWASHIILEGNLSHSILYPGTQRTFKVYIPEQYDGRKPACIVVGLDGITCNAPSVFDSLISTSKMPITIGIFINSGVIKDKQGNVVRYNRSNEFDMTDGRFASFLEKEILPAVQKMKTADGRSIHISQNANDHAIFGLSSGGIASFVAAWTRPDLFSRVFSAVGTFVSFRGGNDLQAFVRKTEPLPIRIFLQDGSNDAWNPLFGHWYEGNKMLYSALSFSGYQVECDWSDGAHNGRRANQIFSSVMTWLWKNWPAPIQPGKTKNNLLNELLTTDRLWHPVANSLTPLPQNKKKSISIKGLNLKGKHFAVYPNHSLLAVEQQGSNCLWQYILDNDGSTSCGQRFYWLHSMDNALIHFGPMLFDAVGNLFVATNWGIQICDQNGRVRGILRLPDNAEGNPTAMQIENGKLIYTDGKGHQFFRNLNIQAAPSEVTPPSQGQG